MTEEIYRQPHLYDALYRGFTADIPFYLDLARRDPARTDPARTESPVLELACGSGRVTIPLARAGVAVTGVDISPEMIAAARAAARKAAPEPVNPCFVVGDMRYPVESPHGPPFRLVLIPLHSLSHLLDTGDVLQCLTTAAAQLGRGGRLALAVHNPDPAMLTRDPEALFPVDMPGESPWTVLESARYDQEWRILHLQWWLEPAEEAAGRHDGDPIPVSFDLRIFSPGELDALLEEARFSLEERWGWYDRSPFTEESGTQVVVARVRD